MLNSLSSNYLSLEKTGGLFDIDATLPVLLIQFFLLVFLLKALAILNATATASPPVLANLT